MVAKRTLPDKERGDSFCSIADHIQWAVQSDGIHVIDTKTGCQHHLSYPQAAVWDMLSRHYGRDAMAQRIAPIAGVDSATAGRLVDETLSGWCAEGLVKMEHRGG
jgi:hypothetical protein